MNSYIFLLILYEASPSCNSSDFIGLYLAVSFGSASLLMLVLSSTVFIIVTISLLRSKAKVTRELMQARESIEGPVTADYEDIVIELDQQSETVSSGISTKDNVAYDHVPGQR